MSKIPLYTQTTYDWHCHKKQMPKPYAVDLNVGTNEYVFGRVTPDNKFIVTTGLVKDAKPHGIKMVGGKRKSKKGGNVYISGKTSNPIYNNNNNENNELIFNALDKINQLSGLDGNRKNSMINASNNIVGGKRKNIKKMKGGKETEGATGMPSQFYNAKMPTKENVKSSVLPDDSAVTNLAPYSKVGGKKSSTKKPVKKPIKKSTVKKAPVKKITVKKTPVKKTTVKKTPVKKTAVKKTPVKKTVVKKTPLKKTTVKKTTTKKRSTKKPKTLKNKLLGLFK